MADITCKNCMYRKSRMFAKGTYNQCVLHKCKLLGETIGRLNEHLKGCPLAIKDETLDEIKAEIKERFGNCDICEYWEDYDYEENNISEYVYKGSINQILEIIDKHKEKQHETQHKENRIP